MLSRINEIKLLLDDDNIFKRGIQAENFKYVLTTEKEDEDIEEEHEVIEYNFENIYNSISFATTNVNNNQNLTFSLISKNPFEIFDSVIIPIINFIREINHLYRITIYTTGSQGSDEQYSILKDLNVSLYVVNDKKLNLLKHGIITIGQFVNLIEEHDPYIMIGPAIVDKSKIKEFLEEWRNNVSRNHKTGCPEFRLFGPG